jgi:hypothetical protein
MDWIAFYHGLTEQIVRITGGSDKLVHVHAGLFVYLGMQVLLRDRRSSLTALRTVFALELLNEAMDRLFWGSWRWADTAGDFAATLLWPTAFYAVGRYRRARWAAYHRWSASLDQPIRAPTRHA